MNGRARIQAYTKIKNMLGLQSEWRSTIVSEHRPDCGLKEKEESVPIKGHCFAGRNPGGS